MDYIINENVLAENDIDLVNNTFSVDGLHEDNDYTSSDIESGYSFASTDSDVFVSYTVPQAEYMYGCTATVVGMLIGYYDRWGYMGHNMSGLIDGTVELNARGTDGNMYDMDAFNTVLGSAIASREYVERFYKKTPAEELPYTFVDGTNELNTSEWNCIADYIGTGQYWRRNDDLWTIHYFNSVANLKKSSQTTTVNSGQSSISVPIKNIDFKCGLSLYVEDKGYKLDEENCNSFSIDSEGGNFTFEDYCAEIDAGRLVILHITGHSMLGYGYNRETKEIIFDDTYNHDQRMKWGGSYFYSNEDRDLIAVTTIHFNVSATPDSPQSVSAPTYTVSNKNWTNTSITVTASFDKNAVLNEYSFDGKNWQTYTQAVVVDENKTVYFRSKGNNGNTSNITQCQIKNIDKINPTLSISGNVSQWTDEDVILIVKSSDSLSGIASVQYSYDNKTWHNYQDRLVVSENKKIYFRVTDNAGNITLATEVVDKIDKNYSALSAPTYTVSNKNWTNTSVTVTASFSKNSVLDEYSFDGENWQTYTKAVVVNENKTVYFRSKGSSGNFSNITQCQIKNIDRINPTLSVSGNVSQWTDEDVVLKVNYSDSQSGIAAVKYSYDNSTWHDYIEPLVISENKIIHFRVTDNAGNIAYVKEIVDKIAASGPVKPEITADITTPTNQSVTISAIHFGGVEKMEYSYDQDSWQQYEGPFKVNENCKIYFRYYNAAGNISNIMEYEVANIDKAPPILTLEADTETLLETTVLKAVVDEIAVIYYSNDNQNWTQYTDELTVKNNYTYYFKAVDAADNVSYESITFNNIINSVPEKVQGGADGISWKSYASHYVLQLAKNDFKNVLTLDIAGSGVDFYSLVSGNYDCRVRIGTEKEWSDPIAIKGNTSHIKPAYFQSDADGIEDMFFVSSYKNWSSSYSVCHAGIKGVWEGTAEKIKITDKLQVQDIYEGSSDRNTMLLSDFRVGDVICLDDIYSASASEETVGRIFMIDEILAGDGDDIVDLTSQRFEYSSNIVIRGGSGNDVIWANCGENKLFGDSGNDRIVGGNNNDIIVGGSGNDSMHGGGGNDIFCFGGNFGNDIVEQLDGGKIILHFAEENGTWDAEKRIYTAGDNSVAVLSSADVELRFGMDEELASIGAFENFTSEKIFEDHDKNLIA